MHGVVRTNEGGQFHLVHCRRPFNTAWYLRRITPSETDVSYSTRIGTDSISVAVLAFMQQAGLKIAAIQRDPHRAVGLYLIQLQDGERSFSYWRAQSAALGLASDPTRLGSDLHGQDWLFLSGIALAILPEDDRTTLLHALTQAGGAGTRVAFDTNPRPRLWSDQAIMCHWTERAAAGADIVLPSFEDEAIHFGDERPETTAKRYGKLGQTAIVKNAAEAVLIADSGRFSYVSIAPVKRIVDTTAAGDSFNAGFLAGLIRNEPPDVAVRRGAALAGKVVQGRGALVAV